METMLHPLEEENDNIFDEIVLADERFHENGFTVGKEQGQERGFQDGFALGQTHGARIGAELGFYIGFIKTWKGLLEKKEKMKPRKEKALSSLISSIQHFPMDNPETPTLQEDIQEIRAKFKQVCSLLNINPGYKGSSLAEDITF